MRFFMPLSNDPEDGEHLYHSVGDRLKNTKEAPAERRIYLLKFQADGKCRTIAVGDEFRGLGEGPVMAILQGGETSNYYVCTPKHGVLEGEPYAIPKEAGVKVEEFSALR